MGVFDKINKNVRDKLKETQTEVRRMLPIPNPDLRQMMGLKDGLNSKLCLVNKDGSLNIMFRQLSWANPFVLDNAVILDWICIIWLLIFTFLGSWLTFGFVYYIMEYFNGTTCEHEPARGCNNFDKDTNETEIEKHRCVKGVFDYSSALQFSLETMTTIGYGSRAVNSGLMRCYVVIFTVIIQSMTGLILAGLLTGVLIAKFKHSAPNSKIVSFSPEATIVKRKGKLQLVVEVNSQRKIYGASVEGILVCEEFTKEGEHLKRCLKPVHFGMENSNDINETFVHIMWPICVCHEINASSPLYKFSPDNKGFGDFELIVLLKGTTATGGSVLVRTSYIKSEIVWGGKFNMDNVLHQRPPAFVVVVDENGLHQIDKDQSFSNMSAYQIDQENQKVDC